MKARKYFNRAVVALDVPHIGFVPVHSFFFVKIWRPVTKTMNKFYLVMPSAMNIHSSCGLMFRRTLLVL
jgi:hypothetical protein